MSAIDYPIIFEVEFLQEFQEKFGAKRGMLLCLLYQIYLDVGWVEVAKLLPKTSAERAARHLRSAGYMRT